MKLTIATMFVVVVALFGVLVVPAAAADPPTRQEVEQRMGLRSQGDLVRGQRDTTGYVVTAEQAEDLLRAVAPEPDETAAPLIGGICPHDDHLYSAALSMRLTSRITAPRIILIGVFHRARLWDLEDRLVFDSFQAWHGPWGPVVVDPLREEVLARLAPESFVVDNTMHATEHSLEGLMALLQHANHDLSIVPILVPYAGWERIEGLADELAGVLEEIMAKNGWQLGRDVAVVISSDAVHYGPDFEHAPFGTDANAYRQGVDRDLSLIRDHLEGPIRSQALRELLYTLVEADDLRSYRIPWCGRFSIPFGLELVRQLAIAQGLATPEGGLLGYGTSLSEPEPAVAQATRSAGLDYTAPSNLHHWVGFFSLGLSLQGE